jgi:GT2 family glycosyltransferase
MSAGGGTHAVVLTWNDETATRACIASLFAGSVPPARVHLVDNGSTDGCGDRLAHAYADDRRVAFTRNADNLGFAAGVNGGIRRALDAGAARVLIVNNDTECARDCLAALGGALDGDPRAGVAGPLIAYHARPDVIWQAGGSFSRLRAGVRVPLKNRPAAEAGTETVAAGFLTGCAMLVRREAFERAGLFDERLFFYGEDLDFCLRVRAAGFRLLFVPHARMTHKIDNVEAERATPFVFYHRAKSALLLARARFSSPYFLYAAAVHLAAYTPYRAVQAARSADPRATFGAWLRGTADGLFRPDSPRRF